MFSSSRGIFALNRNSSFWGAVIIVLCSYTVSHAQSLNGVNTTGTFGNEVIQGRIFFPAGHKSAMRPVVKLQSDSSSELTTVANVDGSFSFTRLRPDSYTIIVNGGDEYENAIQTVTVGTAGAVPAQGNPFDYAMPLIYQVQIYLQPKSTGALASKAGAIPANVPKAARDLFHKGG